MWCWKDKKDKENGGNSAPDYGICFESRKLPFEEREESSIEFSEIQKILKEKSNDLKTRRRRSQVGVREATKRKNHAQKPKISKKGARNNSELTSENKRNITIKPLKGDHRGQRSTKNHTKSPQKPKKVKNTKKNFEPKNFDWRQKFKKIRHREERSTPSPIGRSYRNDNWRNYNESANVNDFSLGGAKEANFEQLEQEMQDCGAGNGRDGQKQPEKPKNGKRRNVAGWMPTDPKSTKNGQNQGKGGKTHPNKPKNCGGDRLGTQKKPKKHIFENKENINLWNKKRQKRPSKGKDHNLGPNTSHNNYNSPNKDEKTVPTVENRLEKIQYLEAKFLSPTVSRLSRSSSLRRRYPNIYFSPTGNPGKENFYYKEVVKKRVLKMGLSPQEYDNMLEMTREELQDLPDIKLQALMVILSRRDFVQLYRFSDPDYRYYNKKLNVLNTKRLLFDSMNLGIDQTGQNLLSGQMSPRGFQSPRSPNEGLKSMEIGMLSPVSYQNYVAGMKNLNFEENGEKVNGFNLGKNGGLEAAPGVSGRGEDEWDRMRAEMVGVDLQRRKIGDVQENAKNGVFEGGGGGVVSPVAALSPVSPLSPVGGDLGPVRNPVMVQNFTNENSRKRRTSHPRGPICLSPDHIYRQELERAEKVELGGKKGENLKNKKNQKNEKKSQKKGSTGRGKPRRNPLARELNFRKPLEGKISSNISKKIQIKKCKNKHSKGRNQGKEDIISCPSPRVAKNNPLNSPYNDKNEPKKFQKIEKFEKNFNSPDDRKTTKYSRNPSNSPDCSMVVSVSKKIIGSNPEIFYPSYKYQSPKMSKNQILSEEEGHECGHNDQECRVGTFEVDRKLSNRLEAQNRKNQRRAFFEGSPALQDHQRFTASSTTPNNLVSDRSRDNESQKMAKNWKNSRRRNRPSNPKSAHSGSSCGITSSLQTSSYPDSCAQGSSVSKTARNRSKRSSSRTQIFEPGDELLMGNTPNFVRNQTDELILSGFKTQNTQNGQFGNFGFSSKNLGLGADSHRFAAQEYDLPMEGRQDGRRKRSKRAKNPQNRPVVFARSRSYKGYRGPKNGLEQPGGDHMEGIEQPDDRSEGKRGQKKPKNFVYQNREKFFKNKNLGEERRRSPQNGRNLRPLRSRSKNGAKEAKILAVKVDLKTANFGHSERVDHNPKVIKGRNNPNSSPFQVPASPYTQERRKNRKNDLSKNTKNSRKNDLQNNRAYDRGHSGDHQPQKSFSNHSPSIKSPKNRKFKKSQKGQIQPLRQGIQVNSAYNLHNHQHKSHKIIQNGLKNRKIYKNKNSFPALKNDQKNTSSPTSAFCSPRKPMYYSEIGPNASRNGPEAYCPSVPGRPVGGSERVSMTIQDYLRDKKTIISPQNGRFGQRKSSFGASLPMTQKSNFDFSSQNFDPFTTNSMYETIELPIKDSGYSGKPKNSLESRKNFYAKKPKIGRNGRNLGVWTGVGERNVGNNAFKEYRNASEVWNLGRRGLAKVDKKTRKNASRSSRRLREGVNEGRGLGRMVLSEHSLIRSPSNPKKVPGSFSSVLAGIRQEKTLQAYSGAQGAPVMPSIRSEARIMAFSGLNRGVEVKPSVEDPGRVKLISGPSTPGKPSRKVESFSQRQIGAQNRLKQASGHSSPLLKNRHQIRREAYSRASSHSKLSRNGHPSSPVYQKGQISPNNRVIVKTINLQENHFSSPKINRKEHQRKRYSSSCHKSGQNTQKNPKTPKNAPEPKSQVSAFLGQIDNPYGRNGSFSSQKGPLTHTSILKRLNSGRKVLNLSQRKLSTRNVVLGPRKQLGSERGIVDERRGSLISSRKPGSVRKASPPLFLASNLLKVNQNHHGLELISRAINNC